jgi:hypothetical protein
MMSTSSSSRFTHAELCQFESVIGRRCDLEVRLRNQIDGFGITCSTPELATERQTFGSC